MQKERIAEGDACIVRGMHAEMHGEGEACRRRGLQKDMLAE